MSVESIGPLLALVGIAAVAVAAIPSLRTRPRRWKTASLLARAGALGLLAIALEDPSLVREERPGVCVVVAEDRSGSMGAASRPAARRLLDVLWRAAHASQGHASQGHAAQSSSAAPPSRVGAVAFAERTAVVQDPLRASEPIAAQLALGENATDIERALYRAMDLVPKGMAGRVLLFSDGRENRGDARQAARLAKALGIEVATAPHAAREGSVAFERGRLDLPRRASLGERFNLRLWVANEGQAAQEVQVEILRDGEARVVSRGLSIPGGEAQLIEVPYKIETRGLHFLSARIRLGERILDEHVGFIHIVGPPRVLLIEPAPLLAAAFRADQQFEVVASRDLPAGESDLLAFDAVVLCDVPFHRIEPAAVEALDRYLSEGAGGLLLAGGPSWVPPEPDRELALDSILPVKLEARKIKGQGGIDLMIIMDTSGSMMNQMGAGKTAIDVAFDAAVQVASYLRPEDRLGVLFFAAGAAFTWVKPFGPVTAADVPALRDCQARRCFKSGGGINVDEALAEAYPQMPPTRERTQHLILISDTNDSLFVHRTHAQVCAQAAERYGQGISLSAIGVEYRAGGKDGPNLVDLARAGGGDFYLVGFGSDIPSLVLEDLKGRERYVRYVDCSVKAKLDEREGLFGRLSSKDLPVLGGYAISSLKRGARALAWADSKSLRLNGQPVRFEKDDPLLAAWAHGLGRVTAFLAPPGPWARSEKLWSQVLRGTARPHARGELLLRMERDPGGEYRLEAERLDPSPAGTSINGRLLGSDGRGEPLVFREDGERRAWARFRATGKTAQLLLSDGPPANGSLQHIEVHLPASTPATGERRESPSPSPDQDLLDDLGAPLPGGEDADPTPLLRPADPRRHRVELRAWCFLGALALLVLDLLARRWGGDA